MKFDLGKHYRKLLSSLNVCLDWTNLTAASLKNLHALFPYLAKYLSERRMFQPRVVEKIKRFMPSIV
jgi:hypothetical protein